NQAPQGDFAGHRDVGAHWRVSEKRGQRGEHGDAGGRSIFRHRASGNVHVDVHVAKVLRFYADLAVAAADETECGLDRFFHHFADVTGEHNISLTRITCRFNVEHFAAGWRVSEAGDNTRLARFQFGFADVLGRT